MEVIKNSFFSKLLENRIPHLDWSQDEFKNKLSFNQLKYKMILFGGFTLLIVIFYIITTTNILHKLNIFFILTCVICVIGLLVGTQIFYEEPGRKKTFFFILIFIGLAFFLNYLYINPNSIKISTSFFFIIPLLFFILIGLALTYKFFLMYLKKQKGIFGFIINIIFYIPCLFNDFIEFFKKQYNITTNTFIILFILEIGLIISYFYLNKIFDDIKNNNSILRDPLDLNKKYIISDNFKKKLNNYSISFWIYINQNNNNIQEYNILNFGSLTDRGKPRVTYKGSTNIYYIYFSNNTTLLAPFEIKNIPFQRWNHFVINYYNNNNVNLFINGEFIIDQDLSTSLLTETTTDNIIVGEDNGLEGAICNVHFYNNGLREKEILTNYNLFRLNNPPL